VVQKRSFLKKLSFFGGEINALLPKNGIVGAKNILPLPGNKKFYAKPALKKNVPQKKILTWLKSCIMVQKMYD